MDTWLPFLYIIDLWVLDPDFFFKQRIEARYPLLRIFLINLINLEHMLSGFHLCALIDFMASQSPIKQVNLASYRLFLIVNNNELI